MKITFGLAVCILAAAASAAAYMYWHTTVLEYRDAINLKAVESRDSGTTVVRVTGLSGLSAYSVKTITSEREDSSMLIFVHLFLARRGTTGTFEYAVSVPDSVNEVRFGKNKMLIWKREPKQQQN
jgi:hypothetical protein